MSDEAQAIIDEMADIIRGHQVYGNDERIDAPNVSFNVRSEFADRVIAAATKPKGPFPLTFSDGAIFRATKATEDCWQFTQESDDLYITGDDLDKFVVAWLQHRGVDPSAVQTCIANQCQADAYYGGADSDLLPSHDALQSILANAEESI